MIAPEEVGVLRAFAGARRHALSAEAARRRNRHPETELKDSDRVNKVVLTKISSLYQQLTSFSVHWKDHCRSVDLRFDLDGDNFLWCWNDNHRSIDRRSHCRSALLES